jgi:purine-binding chemotaxis protein CheW
MPAVVRVPLAPATLDGLANLRGKVLPIVSLRRLFGFPDQPGTESTRVVVIDLGQPIGFVVDRVSRVVGVEPRQIEDVDAVSTTVEVGLLSGLIKDVGGHAVVMVLDFAKLIDREFHQLSQAAFDRTPGSSSGKPVEKAAVATDELPFVSFHVESQEYAIAIEDVQEIVEVPADIVHVPHSPSHVLGIMTLRNRLLPLVSLRCMFALAERPLDEKSRIIVLSQGTLSVGIAVDGVSEVLRVSRAAVEAMPALLAHEGNLADIAGICRLDSGKRLVSILTTSNLFDHAAVKEALDQVETLDQEAGSTRIEQEAAMEDEQVVVFRLEDEEFAVPIEGVQEIVRVPEELVRVPQADASVEGVINLRGSVLPVVDLRVRLGLPRSERNDRQRIMVFRNGETRTGFVVDQVSEVLKIPLSAIEPAPQFSPDHGRLFSRMANLEQQKRMIQLLDPSSLVEELESHDQTAHR